MNKVIFGLFAIIAFCTSGNSQNYKTENKTSIIEAYEIKTEINVIQTVVKITNKETKKVLPNFIYKFTSTKHEDIKKALNENPEQVSGLLTLEVDGQILYSLDVKNGVIGKVQTYSYSGMKQPCTIRGQFACIDDKLEAMNWIEYGACLVTAPECYAVLHASCAWDNCH